MTNIVADYNIGHRQRLKQRFVKSPSSVDDYEILEMMLFCAIPRKDVKVLAKTLLKEFGGISGVINAAYDRLILVNGVTDAVYSQMRLTKEVLSRAMKAGITDQNILSSWNALIEYLTFFATQLPQDWAYQSSSGGQYMVVELNVLILGPV